MNILHVAPLNFENEASGLTSVIPKIVEYQNCIPNVNSSLMLSHKKYRRSNLDSYKNYNFEVYRFQNIKKLPVYPDLVVFHSTYIPAHMLLSMILIIRKIPYVLFPHGGLSKNSLNAKKLIANKLLFNAYIKKASAIHYLSIGEKTSSINNKVKSFIVANGIEVPNSFHLPQKSDNLNEFKFILINRLDFFNKGLDLLVASVSLIRTELLQNNIKFEIYGPDENNTKLELNRLINKYNLENILKIKDPIYNEVKKMKLLDADAFVLLSRSEGLPTGVLEALSYGLPCLLTPGTNLANTVEKYKCGWKTDYKPENIAKKILEIYHSEKEELGIYSKNAHLFVKNEFSWDKITDETLSFYDRIINMQN